MDENWEYVTDLKQRKADALERIELAASERTSALLEYEEALMYGHGLGLSNTAMAEKAETSETAVRLFIKRRTKKMEVSSD